MRQCAADCTVYLRYATQAVDILNSRIVFEMRFSNLTSFKDRQQMFGNRLLCGVRSRLLQTQIERGRSAFKGFEAHCAGNVGDTSESCGTLKSESAHSMHRLRAVKQGESLFCFETLRLKSSARQRFPA